MTIEEKRQAAIAWLRERGRYTLDNSHTRQRHEEMQRLLRALDEALPPQANKVRRIK